MLRSDNADPIPFSRFDRSPVDSTFDGGMPWATSQKPQVTRTQSAISARSIRMALFVFILSSNSVLGQSQPLKDKVKKTKSFRESTRTLPGCDKEAWGAEGLVPAMPSPSPCHMPRIIITLYFTFQTGWRPFLLLIQSDDASIPWQELFLILSWSFQKRNIWSEQKRKAVGRSLGTVGEQYDG